MHRAPAVGLALALAGGVAWAATTHLANDGSPRALYEHGATYAEFTAADTARHALWAGNYARAPQSADSALRRIAKMRGQWKLLVVAEPWCGDGANSVPYLAWLAERAPNVELRIVRKADAPELLAAHRVDGRVAVPLVVVLDSTYQERGAWIEQPEPLRALVRSRRGMDAEETHDQVVAWYAADAGRAMLAEITTLLDGITAPTPCAAE
jgi:hypothetical protein